MAEFILHLGCEELWAEADKHVEAWISGERKIPPTMSVTEAKDKARDMFRDSGILKVLACTEGQFGKRPAFIINYTSC